MFDPDLPTMIPGLDEHINIFSPKGVLCILMYANPAFPSTDLKYSSIWNSLRFSAMNFLSITLSPLILI